jgi:hypothetical protein
MKLITYNNQTWHVTNEFLSGNGTYDILMVILRNTLTGEILIVPEMDLEDFLKADSSMTIN